ncbi:response regulator [Lederbergia ruris]|uniref:response regulator n=1 Tax=Lederbergia ruris TaxID=217495 RepID=UPI00130E853D
MYRLLIVDDEPIIVDGLVQLFSEVEQELEIYSAYSVAEAMERVLQMKVDIVITDMRMPEKSGLQFIDELQLLWPKCRIIFLSGYDQFDYVYDAVKRNIDSYVLKTEDDAVLIAAVQKSIQKIEEERSVQTELEASRRQMEELQPFLKKEVLETLINGNDDIKELLQNFALDKTVFEIDLDDQWYIIAGQIELTKTTKMENIVLLHEILKQELHPHLSVEFIMYDNHLAAWFLQPKKIQGVFYNAGKVKWEVMKEYSKRFLENIQESYYLRTERKVNFVIGKEPVDVTGVSDQFQQILGICKWIICFSEDMLIMDQGKENAFYKQEADLHDSLFWKKKLLSIENDILEGDEQKALKMIEDIFNQLVRKQYSHIEISDFLFSLSQLILEFLRNKDLYHMVMKGDEELLPSMQQLPILLDSKEKIVFFIKRICQYQAKRKAEGKRNIILAVNKYIQENIAGDLSLTAMADFVHFNPSYLSRFYKEQTGVNLSDVINEVRLKQAKYYLTETEIPIHEIASKLGFNSPSYFTLYFKQNVQQSPQAFRENRRKR